MNRHRRNARGTLKRDESESNHRPNRDTSYDIEEVLPPKSRRNPFKIDKNATDRACHFTPEQKDFGQLTEVDGTDQYQSLLLQQYGFDPLIPETINQLKELRRVLCASTPKVDDSSQYMNPDELLPAFENVEECQWQTVDDANDVDAVIQGCTNHNKGAPCLETSAPVLKNIIISDVPRIKVIAEKFSRFKKDNVELRKLDEKIVCIEYDVFANNKSVPAQKLRAYFSVRPDNVNNQRDTVRNLPSNIKHKFDIDDEDLSKLNDKEIEIIDGKVTENKPYIEDLLIVLKRKHAIYTKKNKSTLDLRALYEMAKSNKPTLDEDFSDTNLLSKAELNEVEQLILNKCTSSMYGINRKTIKPEKDSTRPQKYNNVNVISQSIFVELMRNGNKNV